MEAFSRAGLDEVVLPGHKVVTGGARTIAQDEIKTRGAVPVLSLLFDDAIRPDAPAISELAARSSAFSISYAPRDARDGNWLELLADGLTYDLKGLAPGNGQIHELHPHQFDLPERFNPFRYSSLTLSPGPHLQTGAATTPVLRGQMWLGTLLCELPGVAAVGWLPARTLSGPDHFRRSVTNWLEGGAFPGSGLTALLPSPDGGMQSEGLAFFTGQELRIEPELAADWDEGRRVALGLIQELIERGPIEKRERAGGPAGEALWLDPSSNKRFVRVRAG